MFKHVFLSKWIYITRESTLTNVFQTFNKNSPSSMKA